MRFSLIFFLLLNSSVGSYRNNRLNNNHEKRFPKYKMYSTRSIRTTKPFLQTWSFLLTPILFIHATILLRYTHPKTKHIIILHFRLWSPFKIRRPELLGRALLSRHKRRSIRRDRKNSTIYIFEGRAVPVNFRTPFYRNRLKGCKWPTSKAA